jgi:hypothetical protein
MRKTRLAVAMLGLSALLGVSASAVASQSGGPKKVGQPDDSATFQALLWTEDEFDEFTVIDANDDDFTWTYYDDEATIRIRANSDKETPKDDWLITKGIELKGGKEYRVTIDVRARNSSKPEKFELKMGKDKTIEAMTTTLIEPTEVVNTDEIRFIVFTTVEEDGTYYIGTHAMSDAAMSYFYFDYLAVSAPVDVNAPDTVSNITFTPDEDGESEVKIEYTAPTKSVGGEDLTENMSIEVLRDNTSIRTIKNVVPGSTNSFWDSFSDLDDYEDVERTGYHTWTLIPSNSAGVGRKNSAQCYIGINKPAAPKNVVAKETETPGQVTISWDAPETDVDGYPLKSEYITYTIYEIGSSKIDEVWCDTEDTSYTYQALDADEPQDFKKYVVFASTEGGNSSYAYASMIAVGTPFSLPYKESLAGGAVETLLAIYTNAGSPAWYLLKDTDFDDLSAQDEDNGFIGMYGESIGTSGTLCTGKISLADTSHPVISFYTYALDENDNNTVDVVVTCDGEDHLVKSVKVSDAVDEDLDWMKYTADLSEFAGKTVELGLCCTLVNYTWVLLDNINVEEGIATDLAITDFNVPQSVKSGADFNISVEVTNNGVVTADSYIVTLYRDGKAFKTADAVDIPFEESHTFTFTDNFNVTEAESHTYQAEVTIDDDANTDDNVSDEQTATLAGLDLPTVQNLLILFGDTQTLITWDAPETDLSVTGYNIYFDKALLASTTENQYVGEATTAKPEQFGVSAVYADGESKALAPEETSGIESMSVTPISVRAANSQIKISGDGTKLVTVSDIAGRTYYNATTSLPFALNVAPGVYVVSINNAHLKLIVK